MATLVKVDFGTEKVFQAYDLAKDAAFAEADKVEGITRRNLMTATEMIEFPMPELTGSEKQIAWAKDIRKGMLKDWAKKFEKSEKPFEQIAKNLEQIFGSRSAKMYIETRNSEKMFRAARTKELIAEQKNA